MKKMTVLRQQAYEILGEVPEENLFEVIQYIQSRNLNMLKRAKRIEEKKMALEELKKIIRPVPDLDYKKSLAEYREVKYGNESFS